MLPETALVLYLCGMIFWDLTFANPSVVPVILAKSAQEDCIVMKKMSSISTNDRLFVGSAGIKRI